MVSYTVYVANYVTKKGTHRSYVGHTWSANVREGWLNSSPPNWIKPKTATTVSVKPLEKGIPTKELARAAEDNIFP